jgi:hypothetical protein
LGNGRFISFHYGWFMKGISPGVSLGMDWSEEGTGVDNPYFWAGLLSQAMGNMDGYPASVITKE